MNILAEKWNELVREVKRAHTIAGLGCETKQTPNGCIISGSGTGRGRHPWQVSPSWQIDPKLKLLGGQWTATIWPGFVNGRDATITQSRMIQSKLNTLEVPLTDQDPPALALTSFRNPATSAGIEYSPDGDLITLPGEGYPAFFNQLGVVPVAKRGTGVESIDNQPTDPNRTRQIRACDIALVTPRASARQQVDVLDPTVDSQSVSISTTIDTSAFANAPSAQWLITTSEWQPPKEPTDLDRLMGTAVEPQTDELKLSTVWFVSPPDASSDDPPDNTWTPYPQHFIFWNLNHASLAPIPDATPEPITFPLGSVLAGGVSEQLINSLLSPVNDAYSQIAAYLSSTNYSGMFWST